MATSSQSSWVTARDRTKNAFRFTCCPIVLQQFIEATRDKLVVVPNRVPRGTHHVALMWIFNFVDSVGASSPLRVSAMTEEQRQNAALALYSYLRYECLAYGGSARDLAAYQHDDYCDDVAKGFRLVAPTVPFLRGCLLLQSKLADIHEAVVLLALETVIAIGESVSLIALSQRKVDTLADANHEPHVGAASQEWHVSCDLNSASSERLKTLRVSLQSRSSEPCVIVITLTIPDPPKEEDDLRESIRVQTSAVVSGMLEPKPMVFHPDAFSVPESTSSGPQVPLGWTMPPVIEAHHTVETTGECRAVLTPHDVTCTQEASDGQGVQWCCLKLQAIRVTSNQTRRPVVLSVTAASAQWRDADGQWRTAGGGKPRLTNLLYGSYDSQDDDGTVVLEAAGMIGVMVPIPLPATARIGRNNSERSRCNPSLPQPLVVRVKITEDDDIASHDLTMQQHNEPITLIAVGDAAKGVTFDVGYGLRFTSCDDVNYGARRAAWVYVKPPEENSTPSAMSVSQRDINVDHDALHGSFVVASSEGSSHEFTLRSLRGIAFKCAQRGRASFLYEPMSTDESSEDGMKVTFLVSVPDVMVYAVRVDLWTTSSRSTAYFPVALFGSGWVSVSRPGAAPLLPKPSASPVQQRRGISPSVSSTPKPTSAANSSSCSPAFRAHMMREGVLTPSASPRRRAPTCMTDPLVWVCASCSERSVQRFCHMCGSPRFHDD